MLVVIAEKKRERKGRREDLEPHREVRVIITRVLHYRGRRRVFSVSLNLYYRTTLINHVSRVERIIHLLRALADNQQK